MSCTFRNKLMRTAITKGLRYYSKHENPFSKTWNVISNDLPILGKKQPVKYPEHADIVIIGGGYIGSSAAYWLKTKAGEGLSVVVLEKDCSYSNAQPLQSLGKLSQHYGLPENIQLSKHSAEFLRNISDHLGPCDIQFRPKSHLVLACEKYAQQLEENVINQKELGIKNELLTVEELRNKYPWINTQDIKLGCIGRESEGTYNSHALLKGLIQKANELGTFYVNAEVTGFELEQQRDVLMEGVAPGSFQRINRVIYTTPDEEEHSIKFAICILAAGHRSGDIAALAKIGNGEGILRIPLPIKQRKSIFYTIEDTDKITDLSTPYLMDTSGLWIQRHELKHNVLCGQMPFLNSNDHDLLPHHDHFIQSISPSLSNRIPQFKDLKVTNSHEEIHDFNAFDETGILGPHSYHNNLYIAGGFGMQGCTHAPCIGRALAELIVDGQYMSIDLTRFGFDRLFIDEPMIETNAY